MAPKILPFSFGEEDYTSGMSATINCIVIEGDSPVDIRWNITAQSHSSVQGIVITKVGKSSVLQIDSVDATHTGNYTCTAINAAGMVQYSAQLTVVGTLNAFKTHTLKTTLFIQFAMNFLLSMFRIAHFASALLNGEHCHSIVMPSVHTSNA